MNVLYPVVEGHGETDALPLLVRRISNELLMIYDLEVLQPYRLHRSRIVLFGQELENVIRLGEAKIRQAGGNGCVLILADADDACPAEMHEQFLRFCKQRSFTTQVSFVLANREYEAWLIACGEEMRGHALVRDDALSHPDPESKRDAKGYFERHILLPGGVYSETVDQAKFSSQIDLRVTERKCRSFRKLVCEMRKYLK